MLMPAAAAYFLKARHGERAGRSIRSRDSISATAPGWNGSTSSAIVSPKGLKESHGLMVNYLYALDEIEKNHEAFAEKGVVVTANGVRRMLKPDRAPPELVAMP